MTLYNEIEPYAAEWLRNLVAANLISEGVVEDRSICDLQPSDLDTHTQCHFFAGIGVWSHALRLAGWPDDVEVWTGSCPCQPFSAAGRRKGVSDVRHLWPAWFNLIQHGKPPIVFGEQVASPDGLAWFDLVSTDLEGAGYAVGAADLCAAGVGAPHIRQRLYFVAVSPGQRFERVQLQLQQRQSRQTLSEVAWCREIGVLGDTSGERLAGRSSQPRDDESKQQTVERASGPTGGFWANAEWIPCRDGKYRSAEPGTFPLAHGVTSRVGKVRAYGNAIVPQVAEVFIRSAMDLIVCW